VSPKDTAKRAVAALQRVGLRAEAEKRHQASLAPVGLLREWLMETSVRNGRLDYELSGMQTAYGRGLDLASARAAYLMEIVERRSAWARVADMRCLGHAVEHELVRARLSELVAQGREALDPGSLPWEAPYEDQALHWLTAEEVRDEGVRAVLVPAQLVFLLLNLDEQDLYSGYGSTGLAAGNTMAGARLAGLMEIIERDAEAVTPYHPSLCFRLEADDPETAEVLADYGEKGVDVAFQDLTTEFGVPCYKAFAIAPSGKVAKGAAASLSGPRAALSALTEVPFAYPGGPKSQNAPGDLPVKKLEDLPDFSSGTEVSDLEVVEKTLMAHGYHPLYVDLTMERMNMPVVRAMAPGLEHAADFDESARVSPRLFENYLKHYA
jgi:YcaO-like protein with predicted kinase domain